MGSEGKKLNDRIISISMKLFIAIAILFPYTTRLDAKNTVFILSNFICGIMIIACLFKKNVEHRHKSFYRIFLVLVVIYNLTLGYYNLYYHHYYIEQLNKTISFVLLLILIKKIDNDFLERYRIREFLIVFILITCLASILYFIAGGEAINIQNSNIEFRRQGMFADKRLTWVFGHKSAYGVMLVLFLAIIMKCKDFFFSKILWLISTFIILLTIFVSGSSSTLGLVLITIFFILIPKFNFRKNIALTTSLSVIALIISFLSISYVYNFISEIRDVSTIGNRTYIYKAAQYYLNLFPQGIGKAFGNESLLYEIMDVDNLHNVFLNEALRFSIVVGIVYFIIFITVAMYSVMVNKIWAVGIWVTCFGLFFMDYSLTTDFLSIFFFMVYILFFVKLDKNNTT